MPAIKEAIAVLVTVKAKDKSFKLFLITNLNKYFSIQLAARNSFSLGNDVIVNRLVALVLRF